MERKISITAMLIWLTTYATLAQHKKDSLMMVSDYSAENKELFDLLRFKNIDYYKISFKGIDLKSKTYKITVKEIWKGKLKSQSIVFDSKEMAEMNLDKVADTVLKLKVISEIIPNNKLKVSFMFPRFGITKQYNAIKSDEYSLRNLADESKLPIGYEKSFHFLAYILPYKRSDGSKSWCEVGSNGKDIENWGKKFGIRHYLLFEMKFE